MMRYTKELKNTKEYKFYRNLGYSDKESTVWAMLDLQHGEKDVVEKWKKETGKSFMDFFIDYQEQAEKQAKEKEEMIMSAPVGMPARIITSPVPKAHGFLNTAKGAIMSGRKMVRKEAEVSRSCGFVGQSVSYDSLASFSEEICGETGELSGLEDIRTDSYAPIEEKGPRNTLSSPLATFRPTYNTASVGNCLSHIKANMRIEKSMIRTEEILNYVDYKLKKPEGQKFEVTEEIQEIGGQEYLFLGVKGEEKKKEKLNVCILLDVSGSMYSNSVWMKMILATVVAKMEKGDIFSLVTYSSKDTTVISDLEIDENSVEKILSIIAETVSIGGCTYGSAGIETAYKIVEKNKVEGINRVILMTDGDLNFGIADKDGLKGLIEEKRSTGAYLSVIGTGILNIQDDKLETLAKNGNGNYIVINSQYDIEKNFADDVKFMSLMLPIAKNVKAQVEFNPAKISRYQLIGYENRMLNTEDFRDNTVIAEPFGSGSYFVALFKIWRNEEEKISATELKYQKPVLKESNELATITIRYEEDETFAELPFAVRGESGSENIRKAVQAYQIAQKLRDNPDKLTEQEFVRLLQ